MTTLMIIIICAAIALIPIIILMAKIRQKGFAIILGFICVGLLALTLYLSIAGKPLDYSLHQTKDNYLEMQNDKNISSFRIIVDGIIVNKFPDWDDDNPFTYRLDYSNGQIFIYTKNN